MCIMPRPHPREFREDVIRVAAIVNPGSGSRTSRRISGSESCLTNWLTQADRDEGARSGILHADRGSQFRARKTQQALTRHRMVGSMGQVGSAGDNAAMESSFALLQRNVLDRHRWATRDELRIAIVTWIERTYHRHRHQVALGRLTPIEHETIMTPQTAQAG
jgi:transposase InsO family protein